MSERLYKIGEAAQILGLKSYVLRFWESEFIELSPDRTGKGQRLYSEPDLQLLQFIRHLLHERGLTIEGARKVLAEYRERGETPGRELPDQAYKAILAFNNESDEGLDLPGPSVCPQPGADGAQTAAEDAERIAAQAAARIAQIEAQAAAHAEQIETQAAAYIAKIEAKASARSAEAGKLKEILSGTIAELKEIGALLASSGSGQN